MLVDVATETQKQAVFLVKTQAQVASHFGQSIAAVRLWANQGMPGQSGKYDLGEIVRWLRHEGPWRQHIKPDAGDDPLLAGGDSPGMERYRLAKAETAEYDLAERKGELLSREKARTALGRLAMMLRRLGERLGKSYGNEAAQAVNDVILEFAFSVNDEFGPTGNTADNGSAE